MSRKKILARLAESFARTTTAIMLRQRPVSRPPRRLRQIARVIDRLARRPMDDRWRRRAERLQNELQRESWSYEPEPA